MSEPGLDIILAFILWFIAVVLTVLAMKYLMCCGFFEKARKKIAKTFVILPMKHTWIMVQYILIFLYMFISQLTNILTYCISIL